MFQQVAPEQPFLQLAFWQALEQQQVIGIQAGWVSAHILLQLNDQPIALMPIFLKTHHRGEYVFDHAWADAYARHGLNYYPRLVTSVPFTPVTGARVWLAEGYTLAQLWPSLFEALQVLAQQHKASSWHGLFIDEALRAVVEAAAPHLAIRSHCQFLWTNQDYADFDGFLNRLTAKKRKSIKVERQKIAQQDIRIQWIEGAKISSADIDFFYQCYANTYYVRGQRPYLTRAFFAQLVQSMPQHLLLIKASRQLATDSMDSNSADSVHQDIAGALFFKDQHTLYGRYWGAIEAVDCLHFEVCYYQGIDYAITNKLCYFDPGTQGEHKLIRGFAPVYTYSAHWLSQPDFMQAVNRFCVEERQYVQEYYQSALLSTPFKQST